MSPKEKRVHVTHNSGNNEWYTPVEYIESARRVLQVIELDTASSHLANVVVKALTYYTIQDDGLTKPWKGKTWMNPPYSNKLIEKFCKKLVFYYAVGDVTEAIVLVNNATETKWFHVLAQYASAMVFPQGRISYYSPDGESKSPLQGQVFLYLVENTDKFVEEFAQYGLTVYVMC